MPPGAKRLARIARRLCLDMNIFGRCEMADNVERDSGNSNNALYFIVGGLVVIAGIFLFLYTNGNIGGANDVNINVDAPAATDAPAPAAPAPAPAPSN
jgi:hypothetical protein